VEDKKRTTKDVTINDLFNFCLKNDVEITIGYMNDFSMRAKEGARGTVTIGARFFIDDLGFDEVMAECVRIVKGEKR
jgi:hypothetical protein